MDTDLVVAEVTSAVGLAEGPAGVLDVIRAIVRLEPVPVREVSRHAELPVPIVTAVCNELRKRGVVDRSRPVRLTAPGRAAFAAGDLLGSARCPHCAGRGLVAPAELAGLAERLERLTPATPPAKLELDQTHCTVDSKIRRLLLMSEFGLLAKRVVFLGDDDLTSVALANLIELTGRRDRTGGLAGRITVVDVDRDILAFIGEQAAATGVPVELVEHDLTRPLPAALTGQFDIAFTDPPYTVPGAELFLSRAVAALSAAIGQHVFFAFGARRPEETLSVQALIAGMRLALRSLTPNFNDYLGAGVLAGTSHLYHLRTTEGTRPTIDGAYDGVLYTADTRSAAVRPYRCAGCQAVHPVGPGQPWTTIAQLKEHGCPNCAGVKFRPMPLQRPAPR